MASRLQVEHYVNYGKSLHLHWTFGKPYTANYVPVIHDIYILYIYSGHIRGDMKPIYWLSELYSLRERKLRAGEEWCDACRHSVPLSGSINRLAPGLHPKLIHNMRKASDLLKAGWVTQLEYSQGWHRRIRGDIWNEIWECLAWSQLEQCLEPHPPFQLTEYLMGEEDGTDSIPYS